MSLSLTVACGIVLAALAVMPRALRRIDAVAMAVPAERPVHLDLRRLQPQPRRDPPKRLVDAGAAAEGPVKNTDLISSQASQAQDMSDKKGDPARAAAREVDEFDQLGTPPPPAPAPVPSPSAHTAAETLPAEKAVEAGAFEPVAAEQEKLPPEQPPLKNEAGAAVAPMTRPAESAEQPAPKLAEKTPAETIAKKETAPKPVGERFQVAAAQRAPEVPVQELRAEKGREGGGAEKPGFTSFEANKHVLGEYMLKVRDRVEREWRTALHLRYSGVSRAATTIHCVIRPDGTIESVRILEPGDSLTYAVLCRDAVERAGPFGPFPFDVPEIYRTENLEINWKFSYL
jgi:hypothetical protein